MVKYIYRDRTAITLFGIFKGKNVLENWIPSKVYNKQFFLANTKNQTSNLYRLKQLKYIFESITYIKANSQYCLFVCNSYDSYISKNFIVYYF